MTTLPPMIEQRRSQNVQRGHGIKLRAGRLEFVTVNPGLVLGPALGSDFSASLEAVRKLLDDWIPALPRFGFNVVDVRDIAQLQLLAMTTPSAVGERFIGSCDFYSMADIAKILKQGLGVKARKVPSFSVPDFLVRVIAIFDPVARGRLYELGKPRQVSSEKARRMLGWTTRPLPETILDTGGAFRRRAWCRSTTSRAARSRARTATARRAVCHLLS